jgi:hypothetical protein
MGVSRLRLVDEGYFKHVKLELSEEELEDLFLDLEVRRMYQEELKYTAIDSNPKLTIIFKFRKKNLLHKFSVGILGVLILLFYLLGIVCLVQSGIIFLYQLFL